MKQITKAAVALSILVQPNIGQAAIRCEIVYKASDVSSVPRVYPNSSKYKAPADTSLSNKIDSLKSQKSAKESQLSSAEYDLKSIERKIKDIENPPKYSSGSSSDGGFFGSIFRGIFGEAPKSEPTKKPETKAKESRQDQINTLVNLRQDMLTKLDKHINRTYYEMNHFKDLTNANPKRPKDSELKAIAELTDAFNKEMSDLSKTVTKFIRDVDFVSQGSGATDKFLVEKVIPTLKNEEAYYEVLKDFIESKTKRGEINQRTLEFYNVHLAGQINEVSHLLGRYDKIVEHARRLGSDSVDPKKLETLRSELMSDTAEYNRQFSELLNYGWIHLPEKGGASIRDGHAKLKQIFWEFRSEPEGTITSFTAFYKKNIIDIVRAQNPYLKFFSSSIDWKMETDKISEKTGNQMIRDIKKVTDLNERIISKYAELTSTTVTQIVAPKQAELPTVPPELLTEQKRLIKKMETIAKEIADLEVQIKSAKEEQTKVVESFRPKAIELLREDLKNPRVLRPILDLLSYYSLEYVPKKNKVTLLTASKGTEVSKAETEEVKVLIGELLKKGYQIVFDAESTMAPTIAELTGKNGVAVFGRDTNKLPEAKNRAVIANDYLRMQALGNSQRVITTPNSTVGVGLVMEGIVTDILDVKKASNFEVLNNWERSLFDAKRDLGLDFNKYKRVTRTEDILSASSFGSGFNSESRYLAKLEKSQAYLQFVPENIAVETMGRVVSEAASYAKVMAENEGTGGAVVFGSSRKDKDSVDLTYQLAYILSQNGYAIATGGSAGMMEVANLGAYNGGGPSIGIPIGGRESLGAEKRVASETHTQTITTSGYEQRIPALLGEGSGSRRIVAFAPGGKGTIKELAATLVRLGSQSNAAIEAIVLLDSTYYKPLHEMIQATNLPKEVKELFVLVDSAADAKQLAMDHQTDLETGRRAVPRKVQETYPASGLSDFQFSNWGSSEKDSGPKDNTWKSKSKKKKDKNKNRGEY